MGKLHVAGAVTLGKERGSQYLEVRDGSRIKSGVRLNGLETTYAVKEIT